MSKEASTKWSTMAGKLLGQLTAIWFALMIAAVLFTAPTKLIFWSIKLFWNLF